MLLQRGISYECFTCFFTDNKKRDTVKLSSVFTPAYNIFGSVYVNQKINLTKGDVITIRATPCGGCGSAYTTFSTREMNITKL